MTELLNQMLVGARAELKRFEEKIKSEQLTVYNAQHEIKRLETSALDYKRTIALLEAVVPALTIPAPEVNPYDEIPF